MPKDQKDYGPTASASDVETIEASARVAECRHFWASISGDKWMSCVLCGTSRARDDRVFAATREQNQEGNATGTLGAKPNESNLTKPEGDES